MRTSELRCSPQVREKIVIRLPAKQATIILARSTRQPSSVCLHASFISSAHCSAEQGGATATRVIDTLQPWHDGLLRIQPPFNNGRNYLAQIDIIYPQKRRSYSLPL
jgi:hypothetical protein